MSKESAPEMLNYQVEIKEGGVQFRIKDATGFYSEWRDIDIMFNAPITTARMAALPSRAQIVKEFFKAVNEREEKLRREFPSWVQSAVRQNAKNEVLKEWEQKATECESQDS